MQNDLVLVTGGTGGTAQAVASRFPNCMSPGSNDLDITISEEVKEFMEENRPKILVNCAGYIHPARVDDPSNDSVKFWEREISVNLLGAYYCTKYALLNGAHTIINIASAAGLKGRGGWSGYSASKAGLISLTESLVEEGVNAYCISPHRIATKMRKDLFPDEDPNTLLDPERIADHVLKMVKGEYPRGTHIGIAVDRTYLIER